MISASGGNGILLLVLNSLVPGINFFSYLQSFDGTAFDVNERMTKNRSAVLHAPSFPRYPCSPWYNFRSGM